jgi:SAM-dependent methyltransferase
MRVSVASFIASHLDSKDKSVLEMGAKYINGTIRDVLQPQSMSYTGIDIEAGSCVDYVCDGCEAASMFGDETFDIVVSVDTLEHVLKWECFIVNMKRLVKKGGLVALVTCSPSFPPHSQPDYWRFTTSDLLLFFNDFEIVASTGPEPVGIIAKKPVWWSE